MVQFKVGSTYTARSACDYDCLYAWTVVSRTAKTISVEYHGRVTRRGVFVIDGVEYCKPFGTYSMCPFIEAGRSEVVEEVEADPMDDFNYVGSRHHY